MNLDIKNLVEKIKIDYIIAVGDLSQPTILYDKDGNKIAEGKHSEYIRYLEKAEKENKRCAIYFKKENTITIYNKYGIPIYKGKIEELPKLRDMDFSEKLPKVPEKIKGCETILEAIKTKFKNKIVDPKSITYIDPDVWETKVIVNDDVVIFPEKNAWLAYINLGTSKTSGGETVAMVSENFVYLFRHSVEKCFKEAKPKTIYISCEYYPLENVKKQCKTINDLIAIAKAYGYRVKML